jgi:hypothetical protein
VRASGLLEGLAGVHLTVKGTEQAARAGEGHSGTVPGLATACKAIIGQRLGHSGVHQTVHGAAAVTTGRCQQASALKTRSGMNAQPLA